VFSQLSPKTYFVNLHFESPMVSGVRQIIKTIAVIQTIMFALKMKVSKLLPYAQNLCSLNTFSECIINLFKVLIKK
jgi:hypothetical protein